jgi:Major intrinsic protein
MEGASLGRRAAAEFVGTTFLTLCIIGSGITATRLSPGDPGFQLLLNALATGLGLAAIILAVGTVSGGQLNPAITLVGYLTKELAELVGARNVERPLGGVDGRHLRRHRQALFRERAAQHHRTQGGAGDHRLEVVLPTNATGKAETPGDRPGSRAPINP